MGEYFKGHKLGTCTHMMYITRDEVEYFSGAVAPVPGNELSKYLDFGAGFLYRFPRKNDRAIRLENIDHREPFDYLKVPVPRDFELLHSDFAQVHMSVVGGGKAVVNMPFCPLSQKAADAGFRPINFWPEVQIKGQRYDVDHPNGVTVFACPFCGQNFYCDEEECDVIREALVQMGLDWEAEQIKAYK